MSLLRRVAWIRATGVQEGGVLGLSLPELGVRGVAVVLAIGPCPAIDAAAPGTRVVTGTFVTERAAIVRVWLEGAAEPIGATPSHPFYSEDRSGWVPAGELRAGEPVRTLTGTATVLRLEPVAEPTTVCNLEVHRSHTYYVGGERALVHNPCSPNQANKLIQQGRAPKTILRVDTGKIPGELTHVHFRGGAALNNNGTWKHGAKVLTSAEESFITEVLGWPLP